MIKKIAISQPMLFPWFGEFEKIAMADIFVHGDAVQYKKGYFINRTTIKSREDKKWLTVPLRKRSSKDKIEHVYIDNRQEWKREHLICLENIYRKAPFKNEMIQLVSEVYAYEWEKISDLAISSIQTVCKYYKLDRQRKFMRGSELNLTQSKSLRIIEVAKKLNSNHYICGSGDQKVGDRYLDHELLETQGIKTYYIKYEMARYTQLYGAFTPYVSILDLIANLGEKIEYLFQSKIYYWKDLI